MRPEKISVIKAVAEQFAELSTCSSRIKVGAVLFDKDFRIVATGYNGVPQGSQHCDEIGCVYDAAGSCIAAVHAEVNAILQCAMYGISTKGLYLYVTHSPCDRCAVVIARAGIRRVIYGELYNKGTRMAEVFRYAKIQSWQHKEKV
jgi:dCMP deaminase